LWGEAFFGAAAMACVLGRPVRRGVTFIELVIVVLILGILTGVATPKFVGSLKFHQAEAAALRIKADLNLARQTAIRRSSTQSVQFTNGTAAYALPGLTHPDHPALAYTVNLTGSSFTVSVNASFGGGPTVTFDRYGAATVGGTVTVSAGGLTKTVSVDATSGTVTIL
jgi:prepilin-type N-terminal cleavage/methylation domain-containing protein